MAFHIVVIDDDIALQEFYRLLLESEGYKVTISPSFDPSPDSIMALQPDLIILDVLIGGKQRGLSYLQSFLSLPQTTTLPVILVTALPFSSFEAGWTEFIQAQNVPLVAKPFDVDAFLALIHSLLQDTTASHAEMLSNEMLD